MFQRIARLGSRHMPPLATSELNQEAITLLAQWITNDLVSLSISLRPSLNYTEGDGPTILDQNAALMVGSTVSLANGSLTVAFTKNGVPEDRLTVQHAGNGAGQIGVADNTVSYAGTVIGSMSGGTGGSDPLVVSLNANTTAEAVQALLRHITYENTSSNPSILTRILHVTLAGNGSLSSAAAMSITVQSVPDARIQSITVDSEENVLILFSGFAGRAYRVEASQNLVNWESIGTVTTDALGAGIFSENTGGEISSARFYRIAWP
jgi:hypothetical protein